MLKPEQSAADEATMREARAVLSSLVSSLVYTLEAPAAVEQARRVALASLSRMSENELKLFMMRAEGAELEAAELEYAARWGLASSSN